MIDLERGGFLESALSGNWTMVVPDLLYERELLSENGPYLRSLGLGVVELSPDELLLAQEVKRSRPALSLADYFALACAQRKDHVLLSGDKALRAEARARNGIVHGVLWLLDQMHAAGVSSAALVEGLNKIQAHPRCRLPKDEVQRRLRRWRLQLHSR
ncbi:MAG: hypothetical protein EXR39_03325 [Betaproteobacteria bacterium]|nr:hypothetical protein [Betaproteobacteria bacterium]